MNTNTDYTRPQYRALDITADVAEETRSFDALAVPYNVETELWPDVFERFMPGALEPDTNGIKLRLEHRETIGVVRDFTNTDEGARITGVISRTRAGEDAYTLAKDGALSSVSIGFMSDPETMEITEYGDGSTLITHHRATLFEVSLVTVPAYHDAAITEVRSRKEIPSMDNTTKELDELRAALDDLNRKIDGIDLTPPEAPSHPLSSYRNAGDYVRAVALDNVREFADDNGVLANADPRPVWMTGAINLGNAAMTATNIFTRSADLPATGNTIEFPKLESNTIAVAKQEKEGDTLAVGKIVYGHDSASIATYGGYAPLSRQAVERAESGYLSDVFAAQVLAYSRTIEKATRKLLTATIEQQTQATKIKTGGSITEVNALTVDAIINLLLDLQEHYEDENTIYPMSGVIVSSDVYRHLATLSEERKALHFETNPDNKLGTISLETPRATVSGINIVKVPGLTKTLAGYSPAAIRIRESAGAPFRLSAENITNLTNTFTVYGYAAHYAPAPSAIVPVKFGA